jgi:hypothetical protein
MGSIVIAFSASRSTCMSIAVFPAPVRPATIMPGASTFKQFSTVELSTKQLNRNSSSVSAAGLPIVIPCFRMTGLPVLPAFEAAGDGGGTTSFPCDRDASRRARLCFDSPMNSPRTAMATPRNTIDRFIPTRDRQLAS